MSLELGGNDPMIVFADANLEKAAAAAKFGAMFNAGQTCVSVERVYVEAAAYDEFVDLLVDRVGRLRHGMDDDGAFATDVGALATQAQLDVVEGHVTDAVANGARVLTGGSRLPEGLFYAERAERVARRLDCGSVNVNTVLSAPFQLALPMEGWKSSGLGSRSGGAAGMLK